MTYLLDSFDEEFNSDAYEPDENETRCDCDCHAADGGGLTCSECWRNHRADVEKKQPRVTRSVETDYDADKGRKRRHVVTRCDGWMI